MNIRRFTTPNKKAEQKEINRRLLTGGSFSLLETQRLTQDGGILDASLMLTKLVDDVEKFIGIVSTERDIAESKRALKLVSTSEIRYRRLFESAKDGILILNAETGMVMDVNPFLVELLGFPHEAFLGKEIWELGFFKDIVANKAKFEELQQKGYVRYKNLPLETADGRRIAVEFVSNVYLENEHNVIQCNIRDMTASKRLEEERETMRLRLEGVNLLQQTLLLPAPLDQKLKSITDGIVRIFEADFCRIWLIRPGDLCEHDCMYANAKEGSHVCRDRDRCLHLLTSSGRYTHTDGKGHRRVPFGCYKIGRIASGEEHKFITNDVQNDPLVHNHEWARDLGLVSFAGYQLHVPGGQPIGVMATFAKHQITPPEDAMLDGLSSTVAHVIQQAATETALHESEFCYRTVADNTYDFEFWINPEGRFLYASPSCKKVYGRDPAEFLTNPALLRSTIHPDDLAKFDRQVADQKINRIPSESEFRIVLPDGTHRWIAQACLSVFDENGQYLGVRGSDRDMTARKQAEEQLHEKDRLLSEAQRLGHVGSWFYDMTGPISWSEEMYLLYGVSPDSFTPTVESLLSLITPKDRPAMQAWITACAAGEKPGELVYRINRPDGTIRFLKGCGDAVRDAGNKLIHMAGTVEDITVYRRAKEELRRSNAELQTALEQLRIHQKQMVREERLSALGQMASGIAHDFNNVLVPIIGYSEMFLANPEMLGKRDEALSMITDIHTAAEDARSIVKRLGLIRGSEHEGRHMPVNVNEIARSALDLTRPRWDKEMGAKGNPINIVTLLEAGKQTLGDSSQLREALINLIFNAVDAMPKGGTLTISSRVENENVVVEVLDSGTGMTDEAKEHCLEPFFSTKGTKGTGLGLSMVHGIVTRHNGTMEIDSILNKGTTVRITLPCASAESLADKSGKQKTEKDLAITSLRILVADDEEQSRMLFAKMLIRDGHTIVMARTGREAIDKANAGTFDLVITDRSMPEANGDLVALSVKARTPEIPVILLTGFGDIMKDKGECPLGVDRVLSKPLTQQDLRQAIAEVMAGKRV